MVNSLIETGHDFYIEEDALDLGEKTDEDVRVILIIFYQESLTGESVHESAFMVQPNKRKTLAVQERL